MCKTNSLLGPLIFVLSHMLPFWSKSTQWFFVHEEINNFLDFNFSEQRFLHSFLSCEWSQSNCHVFLRTHRRAPTLHPVMTWKWLCRWKNPSEKPESFIIMMAKTEIHVFHKCVAYLWKTQQIPDFSWYFVFTLVIKKILFNSILLWFCP